LLLSSAAVLQGCDCKVLRSGPGGRLRLRLRGERLEANGKVEVEAEVEEEQVLEFCS